MITRQRGGRCANGGFYQIVRLCQSGIDGGV